MGAPAKELGSVVHGLLKRLNKLEGGRLPLCEEETRNAKGRAHTVFSVFFQTIKVLSIVDELSAEVLDPFAGLFLLGWDQLFLRHLGVIVDYS